MNARLMLVMCMLLLQHVDHIGADGCQPSGSLETKLTCPKKPELYFKLRRL